MELVACYKKMADHERYTKLSATIACTCELEILVRNFYFDEMTKSIKSNLKESQQSVLCEMNDCFKIIAVNILPPERDNYIKDSPVRVQILFESLFPREVFCQMASINLESYKESEAAKKVEKKPLDKTNKTELANISNSIQASPKKGSASNQTPTAPDNEEEFITRLFQIFSIPLNKIQSFHLIKLLYF